MVQPTSAELPALMLLVEPTVSAGASNPPLMTSPARAVAHQGGSPSATMRHPILDSRDIIASWPPRRDPPPLVSPGSQLGGRPGHCRLTPSSADRPLVSSVNFRKAC